MRTYAAVAIAMAALAVACERREEPRHAENVPPARMAEPSTAVTEPVMPVDEIDEEFESARENFVKRDFARAAAELNTAATRVTAMGVSGGAKAREEVKPIANGLSRLARNVKNGTVKDVKQFDNELGGVEHSLAKHHLSAARDAWAKRDLQTAGRELSLSAHDLEGIGLRTGTALDADTERGIRYAREVGGKLTQGVEQAPADFEKAAKGLEQGIDKLGHAVRPGHK